MLKKRLLLMLLTVKLLELKAQNLEKPRFKIRYSQTTNVGGVMPLDNLSDRNSAGFNFGTVVEGDLSPHVFARFTWDNFQFGFSQKTTIGTKTISINGTNGGNAFYFSGGYYTDVRKWKYYAFAGAGYTTLNDPEVQNDVIDGANYTYLSNQNLGSLSLNLGIGTGYTLSLNEKLTLEANFLHLPNIDNSAFLSFQIGYRVAIASPK
jgi:hypothetical protein